MDAVRLLRELTERRWAWRTFLALAFLVPVLLVLPHARSLVVRNAVITAYLSDLRAPISGEVEAINLRPGSMPAPGVPAMILRNDRVDGSRVARLQVQRNAAERQVAGLRENLDATRTILAERQAQLESYVQAVYLEVNKQLRQAQDEARALKVVLKSASASLERARSLSGDDLLSLSELEASEADYEEALSRFSANQLEIERLSQQLVEIGQGVFQVTVPDGVLLTQQMTQQLVLEVIQLERQFHQGETEWRVAEAEYQKAAAALQHASVAEIQLRPTATVWNIYASLGAWVTEGTPLMSVVDCSNLLVDIAIDDATLEMIKPDQKVKLRLFGTLKYLTAKVVLVRGSGGLGDTPVLAAKVQHRGKREGRVLAKLDESRLTVMPQESCAIGRIAYAEFEGIGLLQIFLYPFFH